MSAKTYSRLFMIPLIALAALSSDRAWSQSPKAPAPAQTILFGAAYYEEYAPTDRLDEDIRMMKASNITVVRIAESTWGTLEPQEGVFDFSHVDRVLTAMDKAGIKVIVGTPTYAFPTWLARKHPDVLAITPQGPGIYGRRQNMDITNPNFRAAAERVIVALVDHVKDHPSVIGYQVDNETKSYDTSGPNVQAAFVKWMQARHPDLNKLNQDFGLDYWSNRINRWEDFPSVNGSINASLSAAFAEFQRGLVTEYLAWQASLIRQHDRPDQFLTQNFDLDWRGYSYGIQGDVNHFEASRALDVAGIDIYHPTQDHLTGTEIALGGDIARSMRGGQNYLVMETEAQGFPEWTPYPGQLRLQAFSHLASGANMLEYWHWSTTNNAAETYWRGLLSQDEKPNPTYDEAATIGKDLARLGPELVNMKKQNRIAIYVSNQALTAFNAFKFGWTSRTTYNDVMRPFYDALYRMNEEVDFIDPTTADLSHYKLIVVPRSTPHPTRRSNTLMPSPNPAAISSTPSRAASPMRTSRSAPAFKGARWQKPQAFTTTSSPSPKASRSKAIPITWEPQTTPPVGGWNYSHPQRPPSSRSTIIPSGASTPRSRATPMAEVKLPTSASCPPMPSQKRS